MVLALLLAVVAVVAWQDRSQDETDLLVEDLGATTSAAPTPSQGVDAAPGQETTQVEPPTLSPSEQPTVELSVPPTEAPSPTPVVSPTDTPTTGPSTAVPDDPTPQPAPGRLVASPRTLDLGTAGDRTLTLTNKGGTALSYDVATADVWLAAAPASGTLKPGRSRTVTVSAERSGLPEGASQGALTVTWDEGSVAVAVTTARETPPEIGSVSVVRSGCGPAGRTVSVSVPIRDESGVASASIAWNGPGRSGTSTLSGVSADLWAGSLGPFAAGGQVQLEVSATDTRGNEARRGSSLTVDPCPQ